MKKNKGLTLIELIVSIALISIVVVFLFQLLIELKYQDLGNTSKVEYKVAATVITKKIQNILMEEQVDLIETCDSTNTCLKITFASGSYLEIKIQNDNKVLSVVKKDSGGNTIMGDIRQTPEKDETGYLGSFDDLAYTTRYFDPANSSYDYKYDSLLKLELNIYDSKGNTYPIVVYYPYAGGYNFSSTTYHKLTINANGGTWSGVTPQVLAYKQEVTITNPTKIGYVFTGWLISGAESAMNGTKFMMGTENTTITAQFYAYDAMFTYKIGGVAATPGTDFLVLNDGNGNWRVKFLNSGVFRPLVAMTIDAYLVGGGGGGASTSSGDWHGGGGGGGGHTAYAQDIVLTINADYTVTIGGGGGAASNGGTSTAFSQSAVGGYGTGDHNGAHGGSGGGAGGCNCSPANSGGGGSYGGSGGANGRGESSGGAGSGVTTCEFNQGTTAGCNLGITPYAGGGGGGPGMTGGVSGAFGGNGAGCSGSNTGCGGAGGAGWNGASTGGSGVKGIVVIRNS